MHTAVMSPRPSLLRKPDPLAYTYPDTWDAATPAELHEASWGLWHQKMLSDPEWTEPRSRTYYVSAWANPPIEDMVWTVEPLPEGYFSRSVFGRVLRDGRVIRRVYVSMCTNLSLQSAIHLCYASAASPVLWVPDGREAVVIPPTGPSSTVDIMDAAAVTSVLRGVHVEVGLRHRPALILWLRAYGYNPIPEFPRLFEAPNPD